MRSYYQRFTEAMLSEVENIADAVAHQGEKGRNNEQVLVRFLEKYLPKRYSIDTGHVVASNGDRSSQTDIIIHDRLNTPALFLAGASILVPIETTYAVISVKTTLNKAELRSAVEQIASVRRLPNEASFQYSRGEILKWQAPAGTVLRPRGIVFAYKATWKSVEKINEAFLEAIETVEDAYRPNALCIIDRCLIRRLPYKLETRIHEVDPLLHFFLFLLNLIQPMPSRLVDLEKYFDPYPE